MKPESEPNEVQASPVRVIQSISLQTKVSGHQISLLGAKSLERSRVEGRSRP